MIAINADVGPVQALQLQVAARSDPTAKVPEGLRARDTGSTGPAKQSADQATLPDVRSQLTLHPHHLEFLGRVEAIMKAHEADIAGLDLSTEAARLHALQVRQQLETQPYGISHRASQIALALFR